MSRLDTVIASLDSIKGGKLKDRLLHEISYARRVSQALNGKHEGLILESIDKLLSIVREKGVLSDADALLIEKTLLPMSPDCKKYELLLCGHAHIDMNWMWRYDETVQITLDTFHTVLDLMNEFPQFTFSQSQASVYAIVEKYDKALLEKIAKRVQEGRWEVTASTWVEADRNMPLSESMARHQLYTRRYLPALLQSDKAKTRIDFEPDTFGHGRNTPELLSQAGIKYYYHCRGYDQHTLYRWRAPSGSEILVYREPFWYLGYVDYNIAEHVPSFCEEKGVNVALRVYGVGDHGGGPTRRDIVRIIEMMDWPIYASIKFSTFDEFFTRVEHAKAELPLVDHELNAIFTGCYTSQSRIKKGNRYGEKTLLDAESISAFASVALKQPYDRLGFEKGWRNLMFNQFHDILPGSCVMDSREHAMGLYQEVFAVANSSRRSAMNAIASNINTSGIQLRDTQEDISQGAGVGFRVEETIALAPVERGGGSKRIYHLFNACAVDRVEVAEITVWDYLADVANIIVHDADGRLIRHQVISSGFDSYWGHNYVRILVEASVPSMGYATITIEQAEQFDTPIKKGMDPRLIRNEDWILENEFLKVECSPRKGNDAFVIIDKENGKKHEIPGFSIVEEDPSKGMTSWVMGKPIARRPLADKRYYKRTIQGNLMNAISVRVPIDESSYLEYVLSLASGSRIVSIDMTCHWLLQGSKSKVPQLRFDANALPLSHENKTGYLYDIPGGLLMRNAGEDDMPGIRFIAGESIALISDSKYGYAANGETIGVTLIRSSIDPDPYPETGIHRYKLGLMVGRSASICKALHQVQSFLSPLASMAGTSHQGKLPMNHGFLNVKNGDVEIHSIKLAEESDTLLVRGAEIAGKEEQVTMEFAETVSKAVFLNIHEEVIGTIPVINGKVISFQPRKNGVFTLGLEF